MYQERTEQKEKGFTVVQGFFALESLDGVGKSTALHNLAKTGITTFSTPPEHMKHLRVHYDVASLPERFSYYMGGVVEVGRQALFTPGVKVSDRYALTTLAAHEAMGLSEDYIASRLFTGLKPNLPEATILLTADDDTRLNRLIARGANQTDLDNLTINDKIAEGFTKWADIMGHPIVKIDTSGLSKQEVVEEILKYVK